MRQLAMSRKPSLDAIPHKLREAHFFLHRTEVEDRSYAMPFYFSAFCSAARSVTFVLQATLSHVDGFEEWYAPQQEKLGEDGLARLMLKQRNTLLKRGDLGVVGGSLRHDRERTIFKLDSSLLRAHGIPEEVNDVVALCRRHLCLLADIVEDCLEQFRPRLDPHTYLTPEWLRANDLTPEDIEERMGLPRGYTRLKGGEEEWGDRLRLLTMQHPPWPDVSDVTQDLR